MNTTQPAFIVAHDGHIFAVKYHCDSSKLLATVTNQYGCQTTGHRSTMLKTLATPMFRTYRNGVKVRKVQK